MPGCSTFEKNGCVNATSVKFYLRKKRRLNFHRDSIRSPSWSFSFSIALQLGPWMPRPKCRLQPQPQPRPRASLPLSMIRKKFNSAAPQKPCSPLSSPAPRTLQTQSPSSTIHGPATLSRRSIMTSQSSRSARCRPSPSACVPAPSIVGQASFFAVTTPLRCFVLPVASIAELCDSAGDLTFAGSTSICQRLSRCVGKSSRSPRETIGLLERQ